MLVQSQPHREPWDYAAYPIILHLCCYRNPLRLCSLLNCCAPLMPPESVDNMYRVSSFPPALLAELVEIMHPYCYRNALRLCTLFFSFALLLLPESTN